MFVTTDPQIDALHISDTTEHSIGPNGSQNSDISKVELRSDPTKTESPPDGDHVAIMIPDSPLQAYWTRTPPQTPSFNLPSPIPHEPISPTHPDLELSHVGHHHHHHHHHQLLFHSPPHIQYDLHGHPHTTEGIIDEMMLLSPPTTYHHHHHHHLFPAGVTQSHSDHTHQELPDGFLIPTDERVAVEAGLAERHSGLLDSSAVEIPATNAEEQQHSESVTSSISTSTSSSSIASAREPWTLRGYFRRWLGNPDAVKFPTETWSSRIQSTVFTFIAIAILGELNFGALHVSEFTLLEASFGASAVLLYCSITSPLAQPRNTFFGHVLSAFVGVCWEKVFQASVDDPFSLRAIPAALAVATAVFFMSLFNCVHPPGGATAALAVIGSAKVKSLGWLFIVMPIGTGALIMIAVAVILNNLFGDRRYPQTWF